MVDTTTVPSTPGSTIPGPTLAEFEAARERVRPAILSTPMQTSRFLSEAVGSPVLLKCENLQRTGSYKIRGAVNRLSQLSDAERAAGVVAASAGNHAQGVAYAARQLGISSTIFMPIGVALPKLQATRRYGAEVVLSGNHVAEALIAAREFAQTTGAVFIPPFDHPDVIAGQGTLGLDLLDEVPDLDTLVVPVGGGGLIAGVASAVRQARPHRPVRVIGVQAANSDAYRPSLDAGAPVTVHTTPTIADGIAVDRPGALNFAIVQHTVDEIVTVDDDETAKALLLVLERAKLLVEPAGVVGIAALLSGRLADRFPEGLGTTVAILSGGNIDPLMLERVVSHGLAASERYLKLRIPLPDRPGQLARTAELVASANANVVEVQHTRHGSGLQIGAVELELHIETRGPDHADQVIGVLRDAGYDPRMV